MKKSFYLINLITLYRLVAALVLVILIFNKKFDLFKWLLALSFFTDLIDGFLARKFKVSSILGSRLDSIADDSTVVAALIGLFVFKPDFIQEEMNFLLGLFVLFLLIRRPPTSTPFPPPPLFRSPAGGAVPVTAPALDPARPARGAALYGQRCAACHGPFGRGDGGFAAEGAMARGEIGRAHV